jgi:hypothetical protein
MVGQGWQYASLYDADVDFDDSRSPESIGIKFFIFTLTIIVTGSVLYIIRYAFIFIFPLKYMDFVDLCAVANVSLFIFDERLHGYYIHGESPANSSDVTIDKLKFALDNEGEGNMAQRGLIKTSPKLQTFEFFLPLAEREYFEKVFIENKKKAKPLKDDEGVFNKKKKAKEQFIYVPKANDPNLDIDEDEFRSVISLKDEMDHHLVELIK